MSLSEEHILHKHTLVMALIANAMQGTGTTLCARRKPSVMDYTSLFMYI